MELTLDILQEFKKITNKDIQGFFTRSMNFFNGSYNRITAFFNGNSSSVDKGAFEEFDSLDRECEDMFTTFQQMSGRLGNLKWYMVLDQLEDIQLRLLTLSNINKWSRSSFTKFGYDQALQASYLMTPGQTLERIAQDVLRSSNPQDDWFNIALANDLEEEEYTNDGGVALQLRFPRVNRGVQVTSVVDTMNGKSIYGKDLYKKIQIDPVEGDLVCLDYDGTIQQTVEILANLKKNDNPSFPQDGLQKEVAVGGNRAALNFPVISRQLSETFATDDTLRDFQLTNIQVDQDALSIDFKVQTRLQETKDGDIVV